MNKWMNAAKTLKDQIDKREKKATDMDIILSRIAQLPPGQLKKILDAETIAIFQKYGLLLDE
ncbi:MAG: hypothetical protein IKY38_04530 [Anaerotignum sp.]|nr:hypothetical protein [Anaerotignum sp.]